MPCLSPTQLSVTPISEEATKWWDKAWRTPTDTEILVLGLLLVSYGDQTKVTAWTRVVLEDAAAQKVAMRNDFEAFVTKLDAKRKDAITHAAGHYESEGRFRGMPEYHIRLYLAALMNTDDKKALLGPGGGSSTRKGAPLRRTSILPHVAKLLKAKRVELQQAFDAGMVSSEKAKQSGTGSASLVEVKRALDEKENAVSSLGEKLRKEARRASRVTHRGVTRAARRAPRGCRALRVRVCTCGARRALRVRVCTCGARGVLSMITLRARAHTGLSPPRGGADSASRPS